MSKEIGPLSGFRDILAEQMFPRQQMIDKIKKVYESYGFVPLDTPAIERLETLTGKYGTEGEKLIYKFQDHGGRNIALRYDLTVPLARVVAQHREEITLPYRRYQVGNVWRGESPQAGRYREFMQFDADIVGTKSVIADTEIVAMMADTMQVLGADAIVKVNNRKVLDGLIKKIYPSDPFGVYSPREFIGLIDKVERIGREDALSLLENNFLKSEDKLAFMRVFLGAEGATLERIKIISNMLGDQPEAQEGLDNLNEVFSILEKAGYQEDQITFDQTIARGLDYYTGIIYETTLRGLPRIGSVCSGGRFDNLVANLGGPDLPAVGTSVGVDRLFTGLKTLGLVKEVSTKSQVLIANFGSDDLGEYMRVASMLRRDGIATEIYYENAKLKKQLRFANEMGIQYMVLLGSDELLKGVATVKNLHTHQQTPIPLEELSIYIQDQ